VLGTVLAHIIARFFHDGDGEGINPVGFQASAVNLKVFSAQYAQPGFCDLAATRIPRAQKQDFCF
jgi:hypothetical protein